MKLPAFLVASLLSLAAQAGALEECTQQQADSPAIASCLKQRHEESERKLAEQEHKSLTAMQQLDATTDNRYHAARVLRRAQQAYQAYRRQQCGWVEASYASGNGAEKARLACEIDLDTQRLADLARQSS
ncbi:lysozyme inhibitor LprI family protein [Chromobacterium sp. IIBBL 290-4]|uniref:lysozyme inhibitor LprI family protein n=1 Tax=Chromobacterium sp. IIBBL 290-4 TaxID=2953890 RepID=UPI0020B7450E|nr:lysozyme inhibitor LprI family protein [Chromobacterium sp. IIBBL 290-4]UTH73365.1 DUF1311 domain-containing protein [Chromobacterium sp. IIBBL 290-4]